MDTKHLFSLFVAIVMVGSIVGFTAFYSFPDQESGTGGEDIAPTQPVAIDFIADNVEASVFQLLPSIKIQAETTETDIIAVNTAVYNIEGVRNVSGTFEQWPYTTLGTGYVYVSTISFEKELSYAEIVEKLKSETSLQTVSGYSFALLELPKTVTMKSVNETLDLSREYTFAENISEAMIEFGSLEGDIIKASVTATFVGENATNIMAFEEENVTASPVQKTALVEGKLASLEGLLLFSGVTPKSLADSVSDLEQDFNAIAGVEAALVFAVNIPAEIYITGDLLGEEKFIELEASLEAVGAESVTVENDPLSATLVFNSEISSSEFSEKIDLVRTKLAEVEVVANVEESSGPFSGEVQITGSDARPQGEEITSKLNELVLQYEIAQPAVLSLAEILDRETDEIYVVESGEIDAMLMYGHDLGDNVNVEVNYTLVRGQLSSARAIEN